MRAGIVLVRANGLPTNAAALWFQTPKVTSSFGRTATTSRNWTGCEICLAVGASLGIRRRYRHVGERIQNLVPLSELRGEINLANLRCLAERHLFDHTADVNPPERFIFD